jgi:hypothetical protein
MPDTTDLWYIRFPDGRVLRAGGTAVVRQQLASGRLPAGTRVRRSPNDKWRGVERYPEFADLASGRGNGTASTGGDDWRATPVREEPATIASRLNPALLGLAGVRGLIEELLAALDSALVRSRLLPAALAGLVLGILAGLPLLPWFHFGLRPPGLGWLLPVAALLVWSWLAVVLSRLAYVEVSRLRPARWRDAVWGCIRPTIHLSLAQGLLLLVLGGAIAGLRWLPGWLLQAGDERSAQAFHIAAQAATVAGIALEMALWPALLLLLPLAALLVVEECSFLSALRQWGGLVRRRLARLLLAEGLALGMALLLAAPLALLAAALASRPIEPDLDLAARLTQRALYGLAGSVVLAYLAVANVFIYLHLRYER